MHNFEFRLPYVSHMLSNHIEDHVCTTCGAKELAVSFEAEYHEWQTGDQIKLTSETEDENGNTISTEYYLTARVADDGTVTWTPDKALYWNGTGKHNLYVTYPEEGQYDSFVIPADQSTPQNLRKADFLNAMWSGNPTTGTITFNLVLRLAKITGSFYIGSEFVVSWDAMEFTYTGASEGTWDPTTHSYTGSTEAGWSTNKGTITVTNHSNVAVTATLAWAQNSDLTGTITGTFTETSGTADDKVLELASAAEGESLNNVDKAPTASAEFGISGDAITANATLGTITVTIAKATN